MHKLQKPENSEFETEKNLREFFYLLLKIDMRNHPELYRKPTHTKPDTTPQNRINKNNK
jgi:hypothetical protein